MHPTSKPYPDKPSGDVAVQSDSVLPGPGVGKPESGSEPDLTTDLTPGPPAKVATKRNDPAAPAAFGRYQVRNALGAGAFGAVYLGHDTQLDRPVAIKVLRGGYDVPQAEAERFLREARRLAQLSHPGIVTVHDVGLDGGQVYLVSDFLEGPDLGRWLRDNRPAWPEATRMAAAVADALAHAHARRIVHRDVKPANIIITTDRGPVLVDFGLGLDDGGAGGSELGIVSGTPAYMAPEQVAGEAHRIDGRTDIHSLGVVLYEMLCGHLPFRANNTRELLRQVRDDEPQPPRQLRPEIPPELERACLKALAKRLQDRYTTAADFAADLRRACPQTDGQASSSLPGPPPEFVPAGETLAPGSIATSQSSPTPASSRRGRAREAERRQVTVLVCGCSLFESEAYLEDLDAEDQVQVLRAFQQACEQVVHQFEGSVVQCNEEGLLACYGYPVAYENAAHRAALTGLGLLEEMKALGKRLRAGRTLELNPWVGIHTGPAVVEAGEESVSLVGEARNVAVRLEDVAAPGQIVCSATTHRLLRGQFECTTLGHRKIKGVAQPVELFQVQGFGEGRSPVEAAEPAGLAPLTGRDQEIGLLKDRWEQAQEGMGQVVLIVGEPGLGKSRLAYTLKEHVRGQMVEGEVDAPVIEWRCSPHYQNTGLYPAIDFFERALAFGREEPPQSRFDRMLHRLEQYGLARPETVPLWASLLSLPTTDRFPLLSLSPARQREETFRALLEWLHIRSARKPVLFVVEELHWVDASTLEFLGQFLAEGLHDSILTLFTFRPEFKTPWPAVAHQTSLALNRLTRSQAGELMRKQTGGALSEELVNQVYDRTGGVPLFVEEFTKMLKESGVLDQAGEGGKQSKTLLARAIPASLQDLVMARLERIEGDREVAQLAATLGREFSYELLAAVATVDEPTLQAELAKLVQAEILYPKGRPPQRTYLFKHALLEDALYNALVKGSRQQFHRRIAEALEARFPQTVETRPEMVAHHFTEAGLPERAVDYWLKAGLRSRERSSEIEAIGHLTRGLEVLAALPESPERDALELQYLNLLGTAYVATRGYSSDEVRPVFVRALEVSRRIGQPQQQFAIMWGIWAWHIVRGELRLSMGLAGEAMEFASRSDDPGLTMEALFLPGLTLLYRGDFAGVRDHCQRAVIDYDDRERTRSWTIHIGQNAGVTHRCYLGLALWHLGFPDQALNVDREMIDLARTIGHPLSLVYALHHSAWLHLYCRRGAVAQEASEEQIQIASAQGFMFYRATGKIYRAAGLLLQGRLEDVFSPLLQGLDEYRATGARVSLPYYLSILGDAYAQAGRFEDARKTFNEALSVGDKNDDRCQEAELHRLLGELSLAESFEEADAEQCFHRAIQTAQAQQSRGWELRATMSLARLWLRQGRRDEACRALAAVYGKYTEGIAMPDLVDAAALMQSLVP